MIETLEKKSNKNAMDEFILIEFPAVDDDEDSYDFCMEDNLSISTSICSELPEFSLEEDEEAMSKESALVMDIEVPVDHPVQPRMVVAKKQKDKDNLPPRRPLAVPTTMMTTSLPPRSRHSNKKRRKKLKLKKQANAAKQALSQLSPLKQNQQSSSSFLTTTAPTNNNNKNNKNSKTKTPKIISSKRRVANVAVSCYHQEVASYRQDVASMRPKHKK